jgi:four helix bundle protein
MKTGLDGDPLREKSYSFAIAIVNMTRSLQREQKEYVLSRQVLRSGTAIGALIREAEFGQSMADFANKMSIALKEANETDYWLSLLKDTNTISIDQYEDLHPPCRELIAMLVATVKTAKRSQR